jgi:hypothetical protein
VIGCRANQVPNFARLASGKVLHIRHFLNEMDRLAPGEIGTSAAAQCPAQNSSQGD